MEARRFLRAAGLSLALLASVSVTASARPGLFLGIGAAQQSAEGDLNGTHAYSDPSGSPQFVEGKLDGGQIGTAATVGYGFGRYFALEYLYANTQHKATNHQVNATSNADFTSQVFAARLTMPFSPRFEAFLRGGQGSYEVDYHAFSKTSAGQLGKVAFTGSGAVFGGGFEIFMSERVGVGLDYMQHQVSLKSGSPAGGQKLSLPASLSVPATTTTLMVTFHF
jgi:hypothetical protein